MAAADLLSSPVETIALGNHALELSIALPGAPGAYRGTRFSWAGVIREAWCLGHRWFGPWRATCHPADWHDEVSGTAGEFGMGTNGMPAPLGFDAAAAGDTFVKIGVGVLRRPDERPYNFAGQYELVEAPRWEVVHEAQRVTMRQELVHGPHAYRYTYRLELAAEETAFITHHTLENLGDVQIHQSHYAHNFVRIDGHPIGPEMELTFPFVPRLQRTCDDLAEVHGNRLLFRRHFMAREAMFSMMTGYSDAIGDNAVTIRQASTGLELRIAGDRPVTRYHLFAVEGAVCPEPFVELILEPATSMSWQHRYTFIDTQPEFNL